MTALARRGMDVVSCFQLGGPGKGRAAWSRDFDGARYRSANAQNRAAFAAAPD